MLRGPLPFFLLVFALSAPIWLVEPREWPISAAVVVPLVAACILVYLDQGPAGVHALLKRVVDWGKIPPAWYVPILLLSPFLSLVAWGVMRAMDVPLHADPQNLAVVVPLLFLLFVVLAVGEEVGWTGYVTDMLQRRWSALSSALILGFVTAAWHLVPLINMGRSPAWIAWWALWSVPLRIFFIWFYNNTRGSVFSAVLFHAMVNLSNSSPFLPRTGTAWELAAVGVVTVIAAVLVVVRWGPGTLAAYR